MLSVKQDRTCRFHPPAGFASEQWAVPAAAGRRNIDLLCVLSLVCMVSPYWETKTGGWYIICPAAVTTAAFQKSQDLPCIQAPCLSLVSQVEVDSNWNETLQTAEKGRQSCHWWEPRHSQKTTPLHLQQKNVSFRKRFKAIRLMQERTKEKWY